MPTPKVRQTPQSRVEKIFREQGFGLVLGLFAVVLAFVFVPVFVVDDLLYVHTVAPEVEGRGHAARPPAHLKHVHVHPHNHTNASVTSVPPKPAEWAAHLANVTAHHRHPHVESLPAEPAPRKRSSAAKPATPEDAPAAKKKKGAVSTGQKQLTAFFGAKK